MSLQFANGESMMMTTECTSSAGNTTNTDVRQKSFSLAGVLESTRSGGSALHRRDAGAESDDAASEKSDKRRQRRNSIV